MLSDEKQIRLRDNTELNASVWEKGRDVWLVCTHGVGEHLGRHQYIHSLFSEYFNICQYDLRGHGKSKGRRGYVENFEDFALDLGEVISFLQNTYKAKRIYLIGHSMGALITAHYLQQVVKEGDLYPEKVFLSAPPVGVPGFLGSLFKLFPLGITDWLSNISGSIPLKGLVDLKYLSHDSRVAQEYIHDELNILSLHSKLLLGLVHTSKIVFSRPLRIKCPLFVAVGDEDHVIDAPAAIDYFKFMEKSAQLLVVEGGYHELHNEIKSLRQKYFDFLESSLFQGV